MSYRKILSRYTIFKSDDIGKSEHQLDVIRSEMQLKYPGNYQLVEYYNPTKMRFDIKLVFENPEEETMFILRNG